MEVTKCDRCGAYIDKPELEMPVIVYRFRDGCGHGHSINNNDTKKRHLCFNCYNEFCKWIESLKEEKDE